MPKELQPHQQRVVDELDELQKKIHNLTVFTTTTKFQDLESLDRHLLVTQLDAMRTYSNILMMRIDRF
ncbi:hypothetical protein BRM13314_00004 [Salmonella phage BRM 13314]|nr:hypothetical protein BRM13314_00004 [Salmonella phage BRM 13314]